VKIKDQNYVIKPIFYWLSIRNNPYFPGLFFSNLAIFDFNFLIYIFNYLHILLLHDVSLQTNLSDQWQWQHEGVFSSWRLPIIAFESLNFCVEILRDRLPTKSNLVIRDIISSESRFCVFGCGQVEFS